MERKRVGFLKFCLFAAIFTIVARLFYIQIIQHDFYVAKASDEHVHENVIEAVRGKIYAMDGNEIVPIVLNETVYTVIFDPMIVNEEKSKEIFEKYAKDNLVAEWDDVFADKNRRYYVVAKGVKYEDAKKIVDELIEENVVGITFDKKTKRVYPEGQMASGLLGFVNEDGDGQYGVEGSFDKELSGIDGSLKAVRDVNGVVLSIGDENIETPAVDGEDVVLTIDRNIQTKVEKILNDYIEKTPATNASAIVMDPRTGEVLAMANVPTYDPAKYSEVEDARLFKNYVVDEPYEAASVCKTFTFTTAIDLGVMNANTTYYNEGSMMVDGLTFQNAYQGLRGTITMQQAFDYSLNTGSATALKLISGGEFNEVGRARLYDHLIKFGLGQATNIELYEEPGFIPKPNEYDWTMNFTYANMTFGQGMNLTMVQIASAVSGIINNGEYYQPTILAGKMQNGKFIKNEREKNTKQIVSVSTSEQMREMLWGTRSSKRNNGVDKPGYFIGGKTGTGQVVQADGSYSEASGEGEMIGSYIGFGGRDGELPEYFIMTKLWGKGQYLGGGEANQAFDDISNYLIDYLKIRPKV
ncbi:penicillin-binding protein 2 [Candidatus Saccharibacteria bacterium]|nr:penicillin-binding protein 2 [Candidatus Saccharibacteria bacterium]